MKFRSTVWGLLACALPGLAGALACGGSSSDTAVVGPRDGGPGAMPEGGGQAAIPADCDPHADARDAPLCVVDGFGLFVDAVSGIDDHPGTRAQPVKTIDAAVRKLAGRSRIFLCGVGPYSETVTITGQTTTSLYGGFACGDFHYDGTRAELAPLVPGAVVTVGGTASEVVLSDLVITAKDASEPGTSSIGIFASSASRLSLLRVGVHAGKGMPAADAAPLSPFSPAVAMNATTRDAVANPLCPASVGGSGGASTRNGAETRNAFNGTPAITPPYPAAYDTGAGGNNTSSSNGCSFSAYGQTGSSGRGGRKGVPVAKLGTLDERGWKANDGVPGGKADDGQGGGGGGANIDRSFGNMDDAFGAPGAPGGCGGSGGAGGRAGGSSIGILAFGSTLVVNDSDIAVSDAGHGGNGGAGQQGQGAGSSTYRDTFGYACAGGSGGTGGGGAGGGGGTGGVSAGILYDGNPPTFNGIPTAASNTTPRILTGAAGAAGRPGAGAPGIVFGSGPTAQTLGAGETGVDGLAGVAKAILPAE